MITAKKFVRTFTTFPEPFPRSHSQRSMTDAAIFRSVILFPRTWVHNHMSMPPSQTLLAEKMYASEELTKSAIRSQQPPRNLNRMQRLERRWRSEGRCTRRRGAWMDRVADRGGSDHCR